MNNINKIKYYLKLHYSLYMKIEMAKKNFGYIKIYSYTFITSYSCTPSIMFMHV